MSEWQRTELERIVRSQTAPAGRVRQAKALLWAAEGVPNAEIARRCGSIPNRCAVGGAGSLRRASGRWGGFSRVGAGTMTHDYRRHGTLDLFAALNVGSGEVLHDTRRTHTGRDVLAFFKWIDAHVERDLELHVFLDNLSAHKSEPVRDWLDHKKRRRWHLHFTPTSSSWLNLVEGWFSVLTRKALTNASFTSLTELQARIDWWVSHRNDNPQPFVWTRTAEEIIDKVTRGRATLDRITKSATHH